MDDIELKRVVLFIVFTKRESAQLLQYAVIVRIAFCIIQGLDAGNILVVQCHVRIAGKQSFPVFAIQFLHPLLIDVLGQLAVSLVVIFHVTCPQGHVGRPLIMGEHGVGIAVDEDIEGGKGVKSDQDRQRDQRQLISVKIIAFAGHTVIAGRNLAK